MRTHIFEVAVVFPEGLNVDHGVDDAALINLTHGRDSLVLGVGPHSLPTTKQHTVLGYITYSRVISIRHAILYGLPVINTVLGIFSLWLIYRFISNLQKIAAKCCGFRLKADLLI